MIGVFRDNGVRYRFLLAVFCCYIPLAVGLGLWSWHQGALAMSLWPVFIAFGVLGWTLIEYALHRYVLHLRLQQSVVQRIIERLHLGHHREPRDEAKVTVPVYASLPVAGALLGIFRGMAGSWEVGGLLMIGSIAGYLWYEVVHFRIHCGTKRGRWLRWQRTNHLFHHYRNQDRCFGVTTPLWDWVSCTGREGLESSRPLRPRVISGAQRSFLKIVDNMASTENLGKCMPLRGMTAKAGQPRPDNDEHSISGDDT
jgi:sterol desaturase/sphingolipid hydroxylase (fatty acid hydroxylase superfamily)